jgi:hypothetical protein
MVCILLPNKKQIVIIIVLKLCPNQKWWQTILEIKVSCIQWKWKGSTCIHEGSKSFILGVGEEGKGFFCFSPCSQYHGVPKGSPKHSQYHLRPTLH